MRLLPLWILLGLALVGTGAIVAGRQRWQGRSDALSAELLATPVAPATPPFTPESLASLPAPVARMFRQVLTPGQPRVATVRLEHRGSFDMGRDTPRWAPFHSRQLVVTARPGFLWDARIRMAPGVPVFVHDAYVSSRGVLTAQVLGLATVMDATPGPDLDEGELLRWAAEAAWYPTALLPGPHLSWAPRDDSSATLTIRDGRSAVTVTVGFDGDGRIALVRADRRARLTDDGPVPTPWEGRFWNYVRRDGMWIPLDGEVAWLLAEGPRPYWRGHLDAVTYTFAP